MPRAIDEYSSPPEASTDRIQAQRKRSFVRVSNLFKSVSFGFLLGQVRCMRSPAQFEKA